MHPFRGSCVLGQLRQESRGVAAESTKSRDCKGSEADVGPTPHPLRVLLELGLVIRTLAICNLKMMYTFNDERTIDARPS
jgi:hypothetical protein